jgi:hypothetical protein
MRNTTVGTHTMPLEGQRIHVPGIDWLVHPVASCARRQRSALSINLADM